MSATNWPNVIKAVLAEEGGYANDPRDPGGETNFGISKRSYPALDIKHLTVQAATDIYHRDFWSHIHGDDLPAGVDLAVMDFAVNSGNSRAVTWMQAVLMETRDGIIGPHTLAAIKAADPASTVNHLCDVRLTYLKGLKNWPHDGKGWTNRVSQVRVKALAMVAGAHQGGAS